MKKLLLPACCLALLGCLPPAFDPVTPKEDRPKTDRQLRNEALKKSLHEFNAYLDNIKTVGLVAPDVLVYELTPGGIGEIIEEWSDQASGRFVESITKELQTRNITVKPIKTAAADEARMTSAKYLYRAISHNLSWNTTYRKGNCPDVQRCPDYSLGPVDSLFKDPDVEALLYVLAYNDVPASEPATTAPEPAASVPVAIAPDQTATQPAPKRRSNRKYAMVNGNPFATGTYVSMALVDRQGNILWYGGKATRKGADLRTRASLDEMTKQVLGLLRAKEKK